MSTVHGVDYGDKGRAMIGALLRRPFMEARSHIVEALHAAGYDDIQGAHLAVFQFPGPDGRSPGELAATTGASKQAMNNLLTHLERAGYLTRIDNPANRRERIIRLTATGTSVIATIRNAVAELEDTWRAALGAREYDHLRTLLIHLNDHLGAEASTGTALPQ